MAVSNNDKFSEKSPIYSEKSPIHSMYFEKSPIYSEKAKIERKTRVPWRKYVPPLELMLSAMSVGRANSKPRSDADAGHGVFE